MRIRNVDSSWDWLFGKGQTNYVRNINSVALDIKMKLWEWYEDCFFGLQNGIPWSVRLGSKNQKTQLDSDVIATVQSVEGVLSVVDFESTLAGRRYIAKFNVFTEYSGDAIPFSFDSSQGSIR